MADREEYRRAQGEIRRKTVLYRKGLLNKAMESLEPQAAYAWATVENVARRSESGAAPQAEAVIEREIKTTEDAIAALQEAVEIKINRMLTNPGELKLSAIRDMQKALEMVEELKKRHGDEKGGESAQLGTGAETIEALRDAIMTELSA
jgi:tetratricopeptide (TPR) repeat protein